MIITALLTLIFLSLAILHFYWSLGFKWGLSHALPTKENGEKLISPRPFQTLLVGILLLIPSCLYARNLLDINLGLPEWTYFYGEWLVVILFLIRAIGDFKYVGLFKKVKSTSFARSDTKYYTPLCIIISILALTAV